MTLSFREARREDVPRLVAMLADDELGARRERSEDPLPASYYEAFAAIESDPNNGILIAESGGAIAAFLQLTFVPHLTHPGWWRATIEGVRVDRAQRGAGIGRQLMQEAIRRAEQRGVGLVQLTTDKTRESALRFYESLGFRPTHIGLKRRAAWRA